MNYKTLLIIILIALNTSTAINAQTENNTSIENTKDIPAFRSSRLIYGRSAQTNKVGDFDIRLSHRFGRFGEGFDG